MNLPLRNGSVVQRQRLPAYTQETMVRVHPESVFDICPCGAARNARHPVTVETWVQIPSRTFFESGTIRNSAKRRSSNLRVLWVRLPLVSLNIKFIARTISNCEVFVIAHQRASAGYWWTQVAVTHPPSGHAGSTPARRSSQCETGPFVYRFRTPASHAGKAGSIPARVISSEE